MPTLINPYTRKPVDVAEAFVDQLVRAGFTEPAVEAAQEKQSPAPRRRTAKKSE
ncbi:hypothetical protein GCM10022377_10150 [Zhihengliuella alba]|uniref:Uncharacterized protein n=1 Tax=Zhihengliuella alba TaxID=547018 RepID=A0ABP7D4N6_9MICC